MAQTIAVANMKGGVGKTTLSIMLAEALANSGHRVLLIDLDAQGSLSFALMGEAKFKVAVDERQTISRYFAERTAPRPHPLSDFVTRNASLLASCKSLDLIAAEPSLQTVERDVIGHLSRFSIGDPFKDPERVTSEWIKKEIQPLLSEYKFIIFDCPPGISIFAFAGIQNSSKIIVPATPDALSMFAIESMHDRVLKNALKGRRPKTWPEIVLILNKCKGTANSPRIYRQKVLEYIEEKRWRARLAVVQIPLKEQIARATEADEDRAWDRFSRKYDEFEASQLVSELVGETTA